MNKKLLIALFGFILVIGTFSLINYDKEVENGCHKYVEYDPHFVFTERGTALEIIERYEQSDDFNGYKIDTIKEYCPKI